MSRINGGQFLFGDIEKEMFRKMMWNAAAFSGIHILTYAVLSNHFHIVVQVPRPERISDEELLHRLQNLYSQKDYTEFQQEFQALQLANDLAGICAFRNRYTRRMFDISAFMKTLKQRFSIWYNRTHKRLGTLWEERFRSVLVEAIGGDGSALETMCAYVDLNPVRAGLSESPERYRWCGIAEAVASNNKALEGIRRLMGETQERQPDAHLLIAVYMRRNFGENTPVAPAGRVACARTRLELLRSHVRYFSYGAVLGSQRYINELFHMHRDQFGASRKSGARRMKGDWNGLCVLRDLQTNLFS